MDIASASSIFTANLTAVGGLISTVVTGVLGVAVALVGVGYGWRKLKHYVAGRKF